MLVTRVAGKMDYGGVGSGTLLLYLNFEVPNS